MHSSSAVRMAVGCLVELAFKVAAGELKVSVCGLAGVGAGGSDLVLLPEQQGMGQPQLLHQSGTILCNLTSQVQVRGGGDSSRRAGGEG